VKLATDTARFDLETAPIRIGRVTLRVRDLGMVSRFYQARDIVASALEQFERRDLPTEAADNSPVAKLYSERAATASAERDVEVVGFAVEWERSYPTAGFNAVQLHFRPF
jgi:hypothetical protein